MKLKVVDCLYHVFDPSLPSVPSSHFTLSPSPRRHETKAIALSNLFSCNTLSKRQTSTQFSRGHSIRRSCSLNMDDMESSSRVNGKESTSHRSQKMHCVTSENPFTDKHGSHQDSFLISQYDFLEAPAMPGIGPELDWPLMEAAIEQKAKSLDIPLSLRMIKKKLQLEKSFKSTKESNHSAYCSVKAAFASMVFIIIELQRHGSPMKQALCHENLDIIASKVQNDTHASFVWLFQEVFSRTPALMLHVMVLLANFSVHSAAPRCVATAEALPSRAVVESMPHMSSHEERQIEMNMWTSMLEEVRKMREGLENEIHGHNITQQFVSPVSVELEPDDNYEDYARTGLQYQMNLSREPNNPLMLCNYAQFLHLVARDSNRAEECFKKAIEVWPQDAESLYQYAKFLYMVRMDFMGAEEMFLQALAVEPDNSYYVSTYANFLWSTGGEETCFPLDDSGSGEN